MDKDDKSLWSRVIERGHEDGKSMVSAAQRRTIDRLFAEAPAEWKLQVRRDLAVYPLYDALAMWINGRQHLLDGNYIPQQTYNAVATLGTMYVERKL